MREQSTRVAQGIMLGLAPLFILLENPLMALSMSLLAISLETTKVSQCQKIQEKVKRRQ